MSEITKNVYMFYWRSESYFIQQQEWEMLLKTDAVQDK
jgi:hypothetical protein